MPANLRALPHPAEEPGRITENALRILLRDRERAVREIAEIDAQMLAYRKSYAAERGEYLLPSLERLQRELLA